MAPTGAFQNFAHWEANITKSFDGFKNLTLKTTLGTKGAMPRGVNLKQLMGDFATFFMREHFIPGMLSKAFIYGEGIPGAHGAVSELQNRMPRIAFAMNRAGEKTFDWESRFGTRSERITKKFNAMVRKLEDHPDWSTPTKGSFTAEGDDALAATNPIAAKILKLRDRQEKEMAKLTAARNIVRGDKVDNLSKESVTEALGSLRSHWAEGFESLWKGMSQIGQPKASGNGVSVGVGNMDEMMKLRLDQYSVTNGGRPKNTSEYNSFFYAAEYGTGIAENVGGPFIREQKANGAESRGPVKGPPGSWWFYDGGGAGGALFTGQQGAHMLFDPATRNPRPQYAEWMQRELPRALDIWMRLRTGGHIRRVE